MSQKLGRQKAPGLFFLIFGRRHDSVESRLGPGQRRIGALILGGHIGPAAAQRIFNLDLKGPFPQAQDIVKALSPDLAGA